MKKRLVTLVLILTVTFKMMAQNNVPPCPMPGISYADAPLIDCCLNGYHFATQPFGGLELPLDFCGTVENGQWLAYQAPPNLVGLVIGIQVANCNNARGMQLQVFEAGNSCDLFDLSPASNCVETPSMDSVIVTNMTPGHVYYIFLDGLQGDICEYTLSVLRRVTCTSQPYLEGPTQVDAGQSATYSVVWPPSNCPYELRNPCGNIDLDTLTCEGGVCSFNVNDLTYTWTAPPGATISGTGPTVDINFGTESGYVSVSIEGPCGSWFLSLYVEVCNLQPPVINALFDCNGTLMFVQDDYDSYHWSNGYSTDYSYAFNSATYSVTVTSAGCTAVASAFIDVVDNGYPQINGPTTRLCPGEIATLTANWPGWLVVSYAWSNGAGNVNSINVTTPGIYTVTLTDGLGCVDYAAFQVNYYPPIAPTNLPALSLCQSQVPYNFFGTNVITSGTYSEVFSAYNGCDSVVVQQITVEPPIGTSINSSAGIMLSNGGTSVLEAVISSPSPLGTFTWSTGETGQTITIDQPGTYSVVYAIGQCSHFASITIVQAGSACPNFNQPVAPSDSCVSAPPFCGSYLAAFCSTNDGYTADLPGNLSSVIPCTIENNQWLTFTVCDTVVDLEFAVNNCQTAAGLEFFVLQTDDCQVFTAPQACFSIASGNSDTLTVGNLTLGETYYLMVDGIQGDICNWEILSAHGISFGTTYQEQNIEGEVVPLDPANVEVCGGSTIAFGFTPPICGLLIPVPDDPSNPLDNNCPTAYQQLCTPHLDTCITLVRYDSVWTVTPYGLGASFVNNDSIGGTVEVIFPSDPPNGEDSLIFFVAVDLVPVEYDTVVCWNPCVQECSTILPAIDPCRIKPRRVKVCFPNDTEEFRIICPGECVFFHGQTFCTPGTYTVTEEGDCGCMNTHTLILDSYFEPYPIIGQPSFTCSPDGSTYTVSFTVENFGQNVFVNNQLLNGMAFTSSPIPSGQAFNFLVQSYGFCIGNVQVVNGSHTCQPCTGNTNNLGTTALCPNECFELLGNNYCAPGSYSELLLNPATNCYDTYIFELTQIVEPELVVGQVSRFCDATNLYYQVGFPIESGTPPFKVNGNPINGNFYQSNLIPSGQAYAFTVTDAASCTPQQVNIDGVFTCNCINNPGSTQFATLYACDGETVEVQYNNDAVLGNGDLLVFILHTDNGASLGQVIAINTTGSFGFMPGMLYGQTYRISPAVGPELGGSVDMNSACFQFTPGQKAVFYKQPVVQIAAPDTLNCAVNTVSLINAVGGGSGEYGYEWSNGSNFNSTEATPSVAEPGAYALLVTDNLTGCTAEAATSVEIDTIPPVFTITGDDITCQEPEAVLAATTQMQGVAFGWLFPSGDTYPGAVVATNIPGDYMAIAQGPNNCIATINTTVIDHSEEPSLEVTHGTLTCDQPSVALSASSNDPDVAFTWTLPDGTLASGNTLVASQIGDYEVVAMTQDGCRADAISTVNQGTDPILTASMEILSPKCFDGSDGSIKLSDGNGGLAPYEFSIEGIGVGTAFEDLAAGSYSLQIKDLNGCTTDSMVVLQAASPFEVNLGADQTVKFGDSITLSIQSSIEPARIQWTGPNGEAWQDVSSLSLRPTESGNYWVSIFNENDCEASDEVAITVISSAKAYLPSAFSPNGDGVNDHFTVFAGGDVKQVKRLQIFDRWGEMIFEDFDFAPNDDKTLGWDGKRAGRAMDPALFVAMAEVEFLDGAKKLITGEVMLLR